MLVENAIKHNIVSKDCNLKIDIYTDDEEYIVVKNNLQKKIVANSTHIGLKNIKDRYKYVTNKEVIILETDKFFKVSVPMLNVEKQ